MGIHIVLAQDNSFVFFQDRVLSLEECCCFAAKNSFEIQLARLDFLIAETEMGVTESMFDTFFSSDLIYEQDKREPLSIIGSDFTQTRSGSFGVSKDLPSGTEFTLSLKDTREWSNSAYVSWNPSHATEGGIGIRQALAKNIFGYIDRRNVSVTELDIKNADLATQERIETLFFNVERAYWEWVFAGKNLQIFRKILEKARDLHQANTRNYDIGRIETGDFLASQANVLIREQDVLIAENKYRRGEEKLKLLMNLEGDVRIYPAQILDYAKRIINLEESLVKAFKLRRDYQQSKRTAEVKNIILETKSNSRWPEIDLVASMTANGIDSEFTKAARKITSEDNIKYFIGVEISIPLENSLASSEFKKASYDKEKAIIEFKNMERQIVTEIGDAYRDYITYEANLNNLQEVARLQEEKLQTEEKRFNFARSDTKRLMDYQQDYLNAQLAVAKSMFDLKIADINLEKSLNLILEKYERLL